MNTYHFVHNGSDLSMLLDGMQYTRAWRSAEFSRYFFGYSGGVDGVIVINGESESMCMLILSGRAMAVDIDSCSDALKNLLNLLSSNT